MRWARLSSGVYELTITGAFKLVCARARACPSNHAHRACTSSIVTLDRRSSRSRARGSHVKELGHMRWARASSYQRERPSSYALERSRARTRGGRPGGWTVLHPRRALAPDVDGPPGPLARGLCSACAVDDYGEEARCHPAVSPRGVAPRPRHAALPRGVAPRRPHASFSEAISRVLLPLVARGGGGDIVGDILDEGR